MWAVCSWNTSVFTKRTLNVWVLNFFVVSRYEHRGKDGTVTTTHEGATVDHLRPAPDPRSPLRHLGKADRRFVWKGWRHSFVSVATDVSTSSCSRRISASAPVHSLFRYTPLRSDWCGVDRGGVEVVGESSRIQCGTTLVGFLIVPH